MTYDHIPTHCPKCQRPLRLRQRPQGLLWGCEGYPECHYHYALPPVVRVLENSACPECTHALQLTQGRFGLFIGCSQFPLCRYHTTLHTANTTQIPCPLCQRGELISRLSRRGKTFYGCSQYPDCTFTLAHQPLHHPCTVCQFPLVMQRHSDQKHYWQCPNKACGARGDLISGTLDDAPSTP